MSCPDCFSGTIHEGIPAGQVRTLHGLQTYVATPPDSAATSKGIIVIIPDAFGMPFNNSRILADTYAKSGFTVYLPDFTNGSSTLLSALLKHSKRLLGIPPPPFAVQVLNALPRPCRSWTS